MKKIIKVFSFVFAFGLLIMSFSACGGNKDSAKKISGNYYGYILAQYKVVVELSEDSEYGGTIRNIYGSDTHRETGFYVKNNFIYEIGSNEILGYIIDENTIVAMMFTDYRYFGTIPSGERFSAEINVKFESTGKVAEDITFYSDGTYKCGEMTGTYVRNGNYLETTDDTFFAITNHYYIVNGTLYEYECVCTKA